MAAPLIEYAVVLIFMIVIVLIGWNLWCIFALKVVNPVLEALKGSPAPFRMCNNTFNHLQSTIRDWENFEFRFRPLPKVEVDVPPQMDTFAIVTLLLLLLIVSLALFNEFLKRFDMSIPKILKGFVDSLGWFLAGIFLKKSGGLTGIRLIPTQPGAIFISYRREDRPDTVARIYEKLKKHFGERAVFRDIGSIEFGDDFPEVLVRAVNHCRVMLAVIGPEWFEFDAQTGKSRLENETDFVRYEISTALQRKIHVIPLIVHGAGYPPRKQLPDGMKKLSDQNGLPIRSDPDFEHDMDRLIKGLENKLKRRWWQTLW